jgi:hypothetical protein
MENSFEVERVDFLQAMNDFYSWFSKCEHSIFLGAMAILFGLNPLLNGFSPPMINKVRAIIKQYFGFEIELDGVNMGWYAADTASESDSDQEADESV